MMVTTTPKTVKVADAVFVGAALLQLENPERQEFSLQEIQERTVREGLWQGAVGSIAAHISRHCVANSVPDGGAYAVLFETRKSMRRLLLPGDPIDRGRIRGKKWPEKEALPPKYAYLVDWAKQRFSQAAAGMDDGWLGSLISARGIGRALSGGVSPDDHVASLREGWK
jgi:hypothetical protein